MRLHHETAKQTTKDGGKQRLGPHMRVGQANMLTYQARLGSLPLLTFDLLHYDANVVTESRKVVGRLRSESLNLLLVVFPLLVAARDIARCRVSRSLGSIGLNL